MVTEKIILAVEAILKGNGLKQALTQTEDLENRLFDLRAAATKNADKLETLAIRTKLSIDKEINKVSKVRHLVLLIKENGQMNFKNIHFNISPELQIFYNEKRELILIGIDDKLKGQVTDNLVSIVHPPD